MASLPQDPQKINKSNNSNIPLSAINQQSNQNLNFTPLSQNSNLNKSNQLTSKDTRSNKNMNSSLNIPSTNTVTNISLNEQNNHQKKEQSDYFDNEISYQDEEEEENDPIFNEYTIINDKRNKAIVDLKDISERIKNNNKKIEEIKKNLIDLKEEKNQKQADIFNLLSNKESIEEIYKNQIYSLNKKNKNINNNINDNSYLNNDKNNLTNKNVKNDNDNSKILINSNNNTKILDNEILNNDEENFKISLNEIKESDQKKYIEQVTNMFGDIFKKRDEKLNSLITNIINNAYILFIKNISEENGNNAELIVTNFFGKISLFISNHSLGKYPESRINLFLRYLLKINSLNVKLDKYIKFVNKKYKEKKKELIDMINFLEKKNINLNEKNRKLENDIKEYDDKLEFFGKNEVLDIDNSDKGLYTYKRDKKLSKERINKNIKIRRDKTNKDKKEDNEEQFSHDIVIEYEDGIEQNVEINYEEDDITNEYNYEKENEMIKKGLNPYKNNDLQIEKKLSVDDDNKQIIVKDESDKYLKELLENKNEKKEKIIVKNRNKEDIDYLIIEDDDDKKDFIDPKDENLLNEQKENKNNNIGKINNKNKKKNSQNKNIKAIEESQLLKKVNYNTNYKTANMVNNLISDKRIFPTPQPRTKINDDSDTKLSAIELGHNSRVQKIMNCQKLNNIFGVNNYKPENNSNGITSNNKRLYSPKKNDSNIPSTSNKIDKTIRIGSKQNHNFISIINITKSIPIKKKNIKERSRIKESKKNGENENKEGDIINLEGNFSNVKNDDENEVEKKNINKTGNEIFSNQANNNSKNQKNNVNEKIENEVNTKNYTNRINKNSNDKKEIQGYFLKIDSKQPTNEKIEKNNSKNKTYDFISENNLISKNENNELLSNNNKKTVKITKSKELNINDIKNNKISYINKKGKIKTKLIYLKNAENKDIFPFNSPLLNPKINNPLTKNIKYKKLSNNSTIGIIKGNNSYFNINDFSIKRANSISENILTTKDEDNNQQNNNTVIGNSGKNNSISPIINKNRKIQNISIDKNKNIKSDIPEENYKKENKSENKYVNKRRK